MSRAREIFPDEWVIGYVDRNHGLYQLGNKDREDPSVVAQWAINHLDDSDWKKLKASERQYKRRQFKKWCRENMGTDIETWDQAAVLFGGELGELIAETGKEAARLIEKLPEDHYLNKVKAPVRIMGVALSNFIFALHADLERAGIDYDEG